MLCGCILGKGSRPAGRHSPSITPGGGGARAGGRRGCCGSAFLPSEVCARSPSSRSAFFPEAAACVEGASLPMTGGGGHAHPHVVPASCLRGGGTGTHGRVAADARRPASLLPAGAALSSVRPPRPEPQARGPTASRVGAPGVKQTVRGRLRPGPLALRAPPQGSPEPSWSPEGSGNTVWKPHCPVSPRGPPSPSQLHPRKTYWHLDEPGPGFTRRRSRRPGPVESREVGSGHSGTHKVPARAQGDPVRS